MIVHIILIDFFYHFLIDNYNQTGNLLTLYKLFNFCFEYRDTILYRDIFGSNTQYCFRAE